MYFEHPKFKFLLKILEAFKDAKIALCINRHDRHWIVIERESGGCQSSYESVYISGSLREKKKEIRCRTRQYYTNTRQLYSGYLKQYEMHPCYPNEDVGNEFLFDLQSQNLNWGIREYCDWNDIIRQYHILNQNQRI
jgi:hypothetical protein